MKTNFLVMLGLMLNICLLASCNGQHTQLAPEEVVSLGSNIGSEKAIAEFESSFYKFANDQGCAKCHSLRTTPLFASADLLTAYQAAVGPQRSSSAPLIDFNNPGASIFIEYAGNAHCGEGACSNPSIEPTVKALIEQWIAVEMEPVVMTGDPTVNPPPPPPPVDPGATMPKFITSSLPVPAVIPVLTVAGVAVMRFPGNALVPAVPALANAIIEVELKMANATEYRFTRLKIVGNTTAITVTGIHIYIKTTGTAGIGIEDLAQSGGWNLISVNAPISTLPATLPATPLNGTSLTLNAPTHAALLSATDIITIGFDNIQ